MRSCCSSVDILGDDTEFPVECQGERALSREWLSTQNCANSRMAPGIHRVALSASKDPRYTGKFNVWATNAALGASDNALGYRFLSRDEDFQGTISVAIAIFVRSGRSMG
jgi:hypothetical protein